MPDSLANEKKTAMWQLQVEWLLTGTPEQKILTKWGNRQHRVTCIMYTCRQLSFKRVSRVLAYYRPGISSLRGQGHFHFEKGNFHCKITFAGAPRPRTGQWRPGPMWPP